MVALAGVVPGTNSAYAEDDAFESRPGVLTNIYAAEGDAFSLVPAPAVPEGRHQVLGGDSPTIRVYYTGFTPEAQAAFQYAVDIWKSTIVTTVDLEIDAHFELLGPRILGSAGPYDFVRNFPNAPGGTWYPIGLANKIAGKDLMEAYPDIVALFSSDAKLWYFGLDGRPPAGKYDFVTVVLHELGHGLGMTGTMSGLGIGSWGLGYTDNSPAIYDTLAVNGSGTTLVSGFKNRTVDLQKQLVGGQVFWKGDLGTTGAKGQKPKLYAPKLWEKGSSFFHLDEATYGAGDPNSLMTPQVGATEAIHNPGPIVLGMFADMGWTTSSTVPSRLGFVSELGVSTPGAPLAVQPAVAVLNDRGVVLATENQVLVTLSLANAPSGAELTCEGGLSLRVSSGVARFKNCRVNMVGTKYEIVATATDLLPVSSAPFAVIVRGNNRLALPGVVRD